MATYRKGDEVISVSYVPGKKRKCLLVGNKYVFTKVASFDDDEAADMFEKQLEYFLGFKNDKTSR